METISIADIGMQMLKPEQVPNEVALTFAKAWVETPTMSIKAGLAAAINAWPGKEIEMVGDDYDFLILPLETGSWR